MLSGLGAFPYEALRTVPQGVCTRYAYHPGEEKLFFTLYNR